MKRRVIATVSVLVLIGIGGGIYYLFSNLNSLVADAIESNGSEVTSTDVGVSGVDISLREGRGGIRGLRVASPEGFSSGDAFSLGDITVDLDLGSVREDPVVIEEVRILAPVVRAQFAKDGSSNLEELRKRIQAYAAGASGSGDGGGGGAAPKIRIERFSFSEGSIEVDASELGIEPRTLTLPSIELTNLGGSQGATPDAIAQEVLGELTRRAINQIARSEVEGLLKDQLDETLGEKAKGLLDQIGN